MFRFFFVLVGISIALAAFLKSYGYSKIDLFELYELKITLDLKIMGVALVIVIISIFLFMLFCWIKDTNLRKKLRKKHSKLKETHFQYLIKKK